MLEVQGSGVSSRNFFSHVGRPEDDEDDDFDEQLRELEERFQR